MIETTTVQVAGLDFTVDVAGPVGGAPLLMLHGFPQSRRAWTSQVQALAAAGYRAIAPDQRGYSPGARPPGVEPYAVGNIVADALGLMDALGHPAFHLVGHDWGGQIAWLTAVQAPERVLSLAVLSRPHPAAFAHAFARDPEQAQRSGHHRALQDDSTVAAVRADDFAGLRGMFAGQGVPAATAQAYTRSRRPARWRPPSPGTAPAPARSALPTSPRSPRAPSTSGATRTGPSAAWPPKPPPTSSPAPTASK